LIVVKFRRVAADGKQILSIMQDPVMQSILQQAQSDPAALQEHMRNPGIKAKISKLVAGNYKDLSPFRSLEADVSIAGVIRVGR